MERRWSWIVILAVMLVGSCGRPIVELDPSIKLRELKVTCGESLVPRNIYFPCEATGTYSDGSKHKVTDSAVWNIEDESILQTAIPDNSSRIRGISPGSTQVTARIGTIQGSASVTITDALPVAMALAPQNKVFQLGVEQQFTSICIFSDNSYHDVTNSADWFSHDINIAKVSGTAVVQAKRNGSTVISAQFDTIQGSVAITVLDKTLLAIQVNPSATEIIQGLTKSFAALGLYTDLSTVDLSSDATWSVADGGIASASNSAGTKGIVTALNPGTTVLRADYGTFSNTAVISVINPTLETITLSPDLLSLPKGLTQQFTALGHYSNGSDVDITSFVSWSAVDSGVLAVASSPASVGTFAAVDVGTTQIKAVLNGVTGQVTASVTNPTLNSISLSPSSITLAKGQSYSLTATAHYSDGSHLDISHIVTWNSIDPSVMSVSNLAGQQGTLNANGVGSTQISAVMSGVTGQINATVTAAILSSIGLSPATPSLALGTAQNLTATGYYSDGSTQDLTTSATWSSSNGTQVTVSNSTGTKGALATLAMGSATVSATLSGVTGQTLVTVTAATLSSISLTPSNPSLALGTTQSLTATGHYSDGSSVNISSSASWSSSNTSKATVSDTSGTKGLITTVATGSSTVSAVLSGVTGQTLVTVTAAQLTSIALSPSTPSLALGTSQTFTATGTYSDGSSMDVSSSASWNSSDTSKATVSNSSGSKGALTTVSTGSTVVSAVLSGVTGQTTVTVTGAVLSSITLSPSSPSLPLGTTQILTATGTYSDGSTMDISSSATWTSNDASKVTVSNSSGSKGTLGAVAVGSATVFAVLSGVTGQTSATVTAPTLTSIALTPANPSLALGSVQNLTATGTYSDGSTLDITTSAAWSSNDGAKVTVSNSSGSKGALTTVSTGSAVVSAVLSGVTGQTTVTVTAATLTSIALTPSTPSLALGTSQSLTATGTYSDGSTMDISSSATWSSSDTSFANVSNSSGTKGAVATVAIGSATISAVLSGVTGQTLVTIIAPSLSSISLTPSSPLLALGTTQILTATATYSDGSTLDVSTSATWSSSNTSKATVSNAAGSKGTLNTVAAGSSTVSAVLNGVTGQTIVTVTTASLTSIAVTPQNSSIAKGLTQQFTAMGTYSDGSIADITSMATWTSDDASVTISNAAGTRGRATGAGVGSAGISATLNGVTGQTSLSVTAAELVSIAVTPGNSTIIIGQTKQFTATGTYTDGSTANITTSVTWASSNTLTANISNTAGTQGRASGVGLSSTTISATSAGGIVGSTQLNGAL